jgi:N-acetylmuramidase-like protein
MLVQRDLENIVSQVESGGHQEAIHFDGVFYATSHPNPANPIYKAIMEENFCLLETAHMIFCTSWGLFQIEGENIYPDYSFSIKDFLGDYDAQAAAFKRFCLRRSIYFSFDQILNDEVTRRTFARYYNGPDDIDEYAAKLLEAAQKINLKTQSGASE